jgi:hypothetical protein
MVMVMLYTVSYSIQLVITEKSALEATGPFGDRFQVTLPDGRVAVAGTIVSAEEAEDFYYDRIGEDPYEVDVVYHISPNITPYYKHEVMRRIHHRRAGRDSGGGEKK